MSLAELIAVRGMGPTPEVVALAAWAAHRWAGRTASVLTAASPPALVSRLPPPLMGTVPAGGGLGISHLKRFTRRERSCGCLHRSIICR